MRAARTKHRLTQNGAAAAAGVSRKQWALLEQGHNVSVAFLEKVVRSLGITVTIGDDPLAAVTGNALDPVPLLALADEIAAHAERLRTIAFDAALPPSERRTDAAAITAFVEGRGPLSPDDSSQLNRTLQRFTSGVKTPKPSGLKTANRERSRRRKRETSRRG